MAPMEDQADRALQVRTDLLAPQDPAHRDPLEIKDPAAPAADQVLVVPMAPVVHLAQMVTRDPQAKLDHRERVVNVATKDHQVLQEAQDHWDQQDLKDPTDLQVDTILVMSKCDNRALC